MVCFLGGFMWALAWPLFLESMAVEYVEVDLKQLLYQCPFQADIAGYGWRAPYIIAAVPGLIVAVLLICTLKDPKPDIAPVVQRSTSPNAENRTYFQKLMKSCTNPALLILLIAAMTRHTAGLTWAYNTRLFFQNYHPHFDLGKYKSLAPSVALTYIYVN